MKKEHINLLDHYQSLEKVRKGKGSRAVNMAAVLLITLILPGAYAFTLWLQDSQLKSENTELAAFAENPAILKQVNEIAKKNRRLNDLKSMLTELDSMNAALDAMPRIESTILGKIADCLPIGTTIMQISFDGQWFFITTKSSNLLRPSEFARNLSNTGIFEDVVYSGYYVDNSGKTAYIGTVQVALKIGE